MIHKRFLYRQLTRSGGQPLLFVICVMLSIQCLVALEGFNSSVRRSLLRDAKSLHAADIIIQSNAPLSGEILSAVKMLKERNEVQSTPTQEFYSMVRTPSGTGSLLADLKVVGPEYPFYGQVLLASGKAFQSVLKPGGIIVEQPLLDRLNLSVGDPLGVGDRTLTVLDVVLSESDRPVSFLSFGPRVFVALEDAESLHLMQPGSRVSYKLLLKVNAGKDLNRLAATLNQSIGSGQESVETFQTARSRIKRFFDNLFFFLTLISLFTLLLAGFGIRSTLLAFIGDKAPTIAILKALGGTSRNISTHFMILAALMGLFGTLLGIASGFGLQRLIPLLLGPLLPATTPLPLAASGFVILKGLFLGILVTVLFTITPLNRLKEIRPSAVFRKEAPPPSKGPRRYFPGFVLFLFFSGLILWEVSDVSTGLWFIAFLTGLILVAGLAARGFLAVLKRLHPRDLAFRQAVRGLFRPGNAPISIVVTLSVSLSIIFSLYLVEKNLDTAFVDAYPADAPNLFFIDIQPDQAGPFTAELGSPAILHPIIRARLLSVNDEKITGSNEKKRQGDTLTRPFNLTYRDHLLEDEAIVSGKTLFADGIKDLQVSVLDTVLEMRPMNIGDRLAFKIQGVPVEATISSIRTRTRESISPFFYFVFPKDSLIKDAPQTFFTAVRLPTDRISELQHRLISRFPNISAIDVTQTLTAFSKIAKRLVTVVRFFTAFSIGAGLLIIISSILATRWDRIQEAAYVKILGARSRFVLRVCATEHLLIGLVSAFLALGISQIASFLVCRYRFEIPYHSHPVESLFLIFATLILVITVGLLASIPVITQKPISFLRNENGG
jgi:putative ABC transport system permease protein